MEIHEVIVNISHIDLKKLCKEKGISIKKLAKLAGVDYAYLNEAKNGKHHISQEYWNKIKKFL